MCATIGDMSINDYRNGKGPLEQEFIKLTGKAHMRIGRRLKKKYAGLNREQIAERLLRRYGLSRQSTVIKAEKQLTVTHSFELQPGRIARLEVPADLSSQEATKLTKLIDLLRPEPNN
jgi:hypothetical protein